MTGFYLCNEMLKNNIYILNLCSHILHCDCIFQPTVGPPISADEAGEDWGKKIEMKDYSDTDERDVRKEIEDSLDQFVEEPLGGYRVDPTDESQEAELKKLLISMQDPNADNGSFAIHPEDDLSTIYGKLTASDSDFQLF